VHIIQNKNIYKSIPNPLCELKSNKMARLALPLHTIHLEIHTNGKQSNF